MKKLLASLVMALTFMGAGSSAHAAFWHKPPGGAQSGYGSPAAYLTDTITETTLGSAEDGSLVWIYRPAILKHGDSAPVVVFLHGFAALKPFAYRSHIRHLARQGTIVIYPQYQISQGPGLLADNGLKGEVDQSLYARRAVMATESALVALGSAADRSKVYIYGHSLGGLISVAWERQGGIRPVHYTLAHPALDSTAGMPPFVRKLVKIKPIDWQEGAGYISAPVTFLHGVDDNIAPLAQSQQLAAVLAARGIPFVLYKAVPDGYGRPRLSPNHGAPLDALNPIPSNLKFFGISFEFNALDSRYYFAGLDAVMDGKGDAVPFDFGTWSNGRPVIPPVVDRQYPQ